MPMTHRPTNPEAELLLNKYFPVHNHGFVALKDYMGTDACIENAARVSYGQGTRPVSDTEKLLRRLKRDNHTSPFEMVELKFHCAMPIFVARQWIRHRTASVNEYSGRYSKMPAMFYEPLPEQVCHQSKRNKQGRAAQVLPDLYDEFKLATDFNRKHDVSFYDWCLENDFAREIARIDLPLSTYTQWYWKIDLHNLMHFLTLRCAPEAQWEIREYALRMAAMVREIAPISFSAWLDYQLNSLTLSAHEVFYLKEGTIPASVIDWKKIKIPHISEFASNDGSCFAADWT